MTVFLGKPPSRKVFSPLPVSTSIGWAPTVVGTVVSFVVAYASIAWLLRFVVRHSIVTFVWYRLLLGAVVLVALAGNWLTAT